MLTDEHIKTKKDSVPCQGGESSLCWRIIYLPKLKCIAQKNLKTNEKKKKELNSVFPCLLTDGSTQNMGLVAKGTNVHCFP